jgi:hypothetical protein
MSSIVNEDLYVRPSKMTPGVQHKIVRARLFAAVEGVKGKTCVVGVKYPSIPRFSRAFRSVEDYTYPTPMHQSALPLEVSK